MNLSQSDEGEGDDAERCTGELLKPPPGLPLCAIGRIMATYVTRMAKRDPANDINLLKEQYKRLVNAVDGFYAGAEFNALNISVILRLLVHETKNSRPLLRRLDPNFLEITIRHKPLPAKRIMNISVPLQIAGDRSKGMSRPDFSTMGSELLPLREWWNGEFQAMGGHRQSKRTIILDVADTAGGAHLDSAVPEEHLTLAEPPFAFVMDNGGEVTVLQPNLAYGVVALAGYEMQDCLERHFALK